MLKQLILLSSMLYASTSSALYIDEMPDFGTALNHNVPELGYHKPMLPETTLDSIGKYKTTVKNKAEWDKLTNAEKSTTLYWKNTENNKGYEGMEDDELIAMVAGKEVIIDKYSSDDDIDEPDDRQIQKPVGEKLIITYSNQIGVVTNLPGNIRDGSLYQHPRHCRACKKGAINDSPYPYYIDKGQVISIRVPRAYNLDPSKINYSNMENIYEDLRQKYGENAVEEFKFALNNARTHGMYGDYMLIGRSNASDDSHVVLPEEIKSLAKTLYDNSNSIYELIKDNKLYGGNNFNYHVRDLFKFIMEGGRVVLDPTKKYYPTTELGSIPYKFEEIKKLMTGSPYITDLTKLIREMTKLYNETVDHSQAQLSLSKVPGDFSKYSCRANMPSNQYGFADYSIHFSQKYLKSINILDSNKYNIDNSPCMLDANESTHYYFNVRFVKFNNSTKTITEGDCTATRKCVAWMYTNRRLLFPVFETSGASSEPAWKIAKLPKDPKEALNKPTVNTTSTPVSPPRVVKIITTRKYDEMPPDDPSKPNNVSNTYIKPTLPENTLSSIGTYTNTVKSKAIWDDLPLSEKINTLYWRNTDNLTPADDELVNANGVIIDKYTDTSSTVDHYFKPLGNDNLIISHTLTSGYSTQLPGCAFTKTLGTHPRSCGEANPIYVKGSQVFSLRIYRPKNVDIKKMVEKTGGIFNISKTSYEKETRFGYSDIMDYVKTLPGYISTPMMGDISLSKVPGDFSKHACRPLQNSARHNPTTIMLIGQKHIPSNSRIPEVCKLDAQESTHYYYNVRLVHDDLKESKCNPDTKKYCKFEIIMTLDQQTSDPSDEPAWKLAGLPNDPNLITQSVTEGGNTGNNASTTNALLMDKDYRYKNPGLNTYNTSSMNNVVKDRETWETLSEENKKRTMFWSNDNLYNSNILTVPVYAAGSSFIPSIYSLVGLPKTLSMDSDCHGFLTIKEECYKTIPIESTNKSIIYVRSKLNSIPNSTLYNAKVYSMQIEAIMDSGTNFELSVSKIPNDFSDFACKDTFGNLTSNRQLIRLGQLGTPSPYLIAPVCYLDPSIPAYFINYKSNGTGIMKLYLDNP